MENPHGLDDFFKNSERLDYIVLRPLSHITMNWELTWDDEKHCYKEEPASFAGLLNTLLMEVTNCDAPDDYHTHEDKLAKYVQDEPKSGISKVGNRWIGEDYQSILIKGGFKDFDQQTLIKAAAGRVKKAKEFEENFENMEIGHAKALGFLLTAILYFRYDSVDFMQEDKGSES